MLSGMPRPVPDYDTKPFWDGCQQERFLVPTCANCGHARWPPGPMCPACQSIETDWIDSSGRGRVYSWVVVTHPVDPLLADQVPYLVAMIDLDEGVRVVGNIDGCEAEQVYADMPVVLYFSDTNQDGIRIPNFRATNSAKAGE